MFRYALDDLNTIVAAIWANDFQKDIAVKYSELIIMDTTHCTNSQYYLLGVICTIDGNNNTINTAYFIVKTENTQALEMVLNWYKLLTNGVVPKVVMTDQSGGIAAAVKSTFSLSEHLLWLF